MTKQHFRLGAVAINQGPDTHIEHDNTTFSLILDQEILEGVVRRFLSIRKVSTQMKCSANITVYLMRSNGVALPDVMGIPQSRHVDRVCRHVQQ